MLDDVEFVGDSGLVLLFELLFELSSNLTFIGSMISLLLLSSLL